MAIEVSGEEQIEGIVGKWGAGHGPEGAQRAGRVRTIRTVAELWSMTTSDAAICRVRNPVPHATSRTWVAAWDSREAAESVEFEMSTGTEAVGEGAGAGIPIVVLGAR